MFDSVRQARMDAGTIASTLDAEEGAPCSTSELLSGCATAHRAVGRAQRDFLAHLAACDDAHVWRDDDCRSMSHWVAINFGISSFKAARMVAAGHALRHLPRIAAALCDGLLSVEKVVELCRFATPDDERKLITWARRVSVTAVRERADAACRIDAEEVEIQERARRVDYWTYDDGMFGLYACLPPDKGAKVAKAIERIAARVPSTPEDSDDPETKASQKRADALVDLASNAIAADADPDRATVVVTVPVRTLSHGDANGTIAPSHVIAPEVARGLCCGARMQFDFVDQVGKVVGVGRASRELPPHQSRALRTRDGHRCTFPGCGNRRFLIEHHIDWWGWDGHSNLDKMLLVCPAHHDLIHKHGWNVRLKDGVEPQWFRPNRSVFVPGPAP